MPYYIAQITYPCQICWQRQFTCVLNYCPADPPTISLKHPINFIHFLLLSLHFTDFDPLERSRELVVDRETYEAVDEMAAYGYLSSVLLTSTTPILATKLYVSVQLVPQIVTRAVVIRGSGVSIKM